MCKAINFGNLYCVIALIVAIPAFAQTQQKSPMVAPSQPALNSATKALPIGKANPNLSDQECTGAGGTIVTKGPLAQACDSGRTCYTTDQKGNGHTVCLSAAAAQ